MLNQTILLKVKQRINKLDSQDYDNIEPWMIIEAFNKAQVEWSRRQLHGLNIVKEGDEQSTRRKDDMQVLLHTLPVVVSENKLFYQGNIPADYLQWKRVDAEATSDCCEARPMVIYFAEEGNVAELLRDHSKRPSFEWNETFATIKNNDILIYTNGEFNLSNVKFTYYRQPRRIEIANVINPYTATVSTVNTESEFKDDIIELLIDEAASIIAGDIESPNQMGRGIQTAERNN
jgi:hypothetical protein